MSTFEYRLIDTHAHLDEIDHIDEVIKEAQEAGISAIIAVGQDYNSNQYILELSSKYKSFILPALGLHPLILGEIDNTEIERILQQIEEHINEIVAIGEVGLDYHKKVTSRASKELQHDIFKSILSMAKKYDKPLSIHTRYAWKDGFLLVKDSGITKAVFHWYTGFINTLHEIINNGYFISATPAAEYHNEHKRAIKETPLLNLLLETDCPVIYGREVRFMAKPADLVRTLQAVSRIKNADTNNVSQITTQNAVNLFGFKLD